MSYGHMHNNDNIVETGSDLKERTRAFKELKYFWLAESRIPQPFLNTVL